MQPVPMKKVESRHYTPNYFRKKMLSGKSGALSRQWESVIRLKFYYCREAAAVPVSKALSDNRRCPERTSAASLLHRHTRCRSDLV